MMKKISIVAGLMMMASSMALAAECESGPQNAQEATQAVVNSTHSNRTRLSLAAKVENSCQKDAFIALMAGNMGDTKKLLLALNVTNTFQAQAFQCLAENGLAMPNKYNYALGVSAACGSAGICALADRKATLSGAYFKASRCE